jgi:hypothetical protein
MSAGIPHLAPLHPANAGVLAYLNRRHPDRPVEIAAWKSAADPYMKCGSHPDVVERVWDQLGRALPRKCACLLCGTPALVQPAAGVVLAFACGTRYCLRVPQAVAAEARARGEKLSVEWTSGGSMNVREALGSDWLFGAWRVEEQTWLREAFDAAASD